MSLKPWISSGTKSLADFRIFKVRSESKTSPRTGANHDFIILDCADWVNVVAVTPDDQLVMIEQYRHGTNTIELEIPGGIMDSHEKSSLETGPRELREETGYEGGAPVILGKIAPNPAIMSNTCHTVLIQNCVLKHATAFDQGEDIVTRLVPVAEIPGLIRAGAIRHSLVVVALYYFDLWRRERGQKPT